jgi:hypothetical protein
LRNAANYAELDEDKEMLLMSYIKMNNSTAQENVWYLDSGCSNHMCGIKSSFSDLDEKFRSL